MDYRNYCSTGHVGISFDGLTVHCPLCHERLKYDETADMLRRSCEECASLREANRSLHDDLVAERCKAKHWGANATAVCTAGHQTIEYVMPSKASVGNPTCPLCLERVRGGRALAQAREALGAADAAHKQTRDAHLLSRTMNIELEEQLDAERRKDKGVGARPFKIEVFNFDGHPKLRCADGHEAIECAVQTDPDSGVLMPCPVCRMRSECAKALEDERRAHQGTKKRWRSRFQALKYFDGDQWSTFAPSDPTDEDATFERTLQNTQDDVAFRHDLLTILRLTAKLEARIRALENK